MLFDSIESLVEAIRHSFEGAKYIAKVSYYAVKTGHDGALFIETFKNEKEMKEAQAKELQKTEKTSTKAGSAIKSAANVVFSPGALRVTAIAGTTFAFLGAVPIGAVALGITAGSTAYQMNRDTNLMRKAQNLIEQSELLKQILDADEKLRELRGKQSPAIERAASPIDPEAINAANVVCNKLKEELEHNGKLTLAEKAKIIAKTIAENSGHLATLAVTGAMLPINPVAFSLAVVDKAVSLIGHSKEGINQAAELKELVLDNQKLLEKFQELDTQKGKESNKPEEVKYDNNALLETLRNKRTELVARELCSWLGEGYNNENSFQIVENRIKDIVSHPELYAPQVREHGVIDLADLEHSNGSYLASTIGKERHKEVSLPAHQEKEGERKEAVNHLIYDWYEWMKTHETLESETKWQSWKKLFKASFNRQKSQELIAGKEQREETRVRIEHVAINSSELDEELRGNFIKALGLPELVPQELINMAIGHKGGDDGLLDNLRKEIENFQAQRVELQGEDNKATIKQMEKEIYEKIELYKELTGNTKEVDKIIKELELSTQTYVKPKTTSLVPEPPAPVDDEKDTPLKAKKEPTKVAYKPLKAKKKPTEVASPGMPNTTSHNDEVKPSRKVGNLAEVAVVQSATSVAADGPHDEKRGEWRETKQSVVKRKEPITKSTKFRDRVKDSTASSRTTVRS